MVIDNKKNIINGFVMRAVSGQLEIDYMSDDRKVETVQYENCGRVSNEVRDVLMEDTIYNLNLNQEENATAISLDEIKKHVDEIVK